MPIRGNDYWLTSHLCTKDHGKSRIQCTQNMHNHQGTTKHKAQHEVPTKPKCGFVNGVTQSWLTAMLIRYGLYKHLQPLLFPLKTCSMTTEPSPTTPIAELENVAMSQVGAWKKVSTNKIWARLFQSKYETNSLMTVNKTHALIKSLV